jgi:hypothetical protein
MRAGRATFVDDPRWQETVDLLASDPAIYEAVGMATLWGTHGLDTAYVMSLPHIQRNAIAQVMLTLMKQRDDALKAQMPNQ